MEKGTKFLARPHRRQLAVATSPIPRHGAVRCVDVACGSLSLWLSTEA